MIFCQQCATPNSYTRETCSSCGARLMVITGTRAANAYGGVESLTKPTVEEHLLERISALESALQHGQEQIDALLELLRRQAAGAISDHAMIEAMVEHLMERGSIEPSALQILWQARIEKHEKQANVDQLFEERIQRTLGAFQGENFDLFSRLLDTGRRLYLGGNPKRGVRYFEKALLLDPGNGPLAFLVGEHFFQINQPALARSYIERSIDNHPENYCGLVMLGVICGDEGDLERAKHYLGSALRIRKQSFTAHYGLGRILVSEGRLHEAIAHLKRALTLKPTPEMYYLVGRAYLEDGRAEIASRHLRRCIDLDPNFDAALYHLGLIYLGEGKLALAQEHFRAAYDINPRESRYRVALRARKPGRLAPLPVFGRAALTSRKVVTSGDVRLAQLLKSDLLESHHPSGEDRKSPKRG